MMKLVRTGIIAAFTTTGTVSAALLGTVADSGRFQLRDNANFRIFARSLGLSNSAARELADRYGQAATDPEILEVACLTAHGALGEAQVDTSPLSQTVVDMNWSETCIEEPYCIVQPRNSGDVAAAIIITSFYGVTFAVRSGGHSPNPGWSSVGKRGILIDLSRLNTISLSTDRSYASVGPSARWLDVYEQLDAEKVVVAGTRVPYVGVGGSILGGGYFFTASEFGLSADNVKNLEVVLANGTIIEANAVENRDLFWALKGGGPNFGIVTRYDLYTLPIYEIWMEFSIYSTDQAPDVLSAFDQWQLDGASDIKSSVSLIISVDVVTVGLLYTEPSIDPPAAFAPFYGLKPLQVPVPARNATFAFVAELVASSFSTTTARHDYTGCSLRIDPQLNQEVYSSWREKAVAAHNSAGVNQSFSIQHIGANLARQSIKKGGNPLNLPDGAMQWWTTIVDWEGEENDVLARSVSADTVALYEELATQRGINLEFIFMNDASRDQNPLASYGSESVERLRCIALEYDPEQVFQRLQNGGFLLSRA